MGGEDSPCCLDILKLLLGDFFLRVRSFFLFLRAGEVFGVLREFSLLSWHGLISLFGKGLNGCPPRDF